MEFDVCDEPAPEMVEPMRQRCRVAVTVAKVFRAEDDLMSTPALMLEALADVVVLIGTNRDSSWQIHCDGLRFSVGFGCLRGLLQSWQTQAQWYTNGQQNRQQDRDAHCGRDQWTVVWHVYRELNFGVYAL